MPRRAWVWLMAVVAGALVVTGVALTSRYGGLTRPTPASPAAPNPGTGPAAGGRDAAGGPAPGEVLSATTGGPPGATSVPLAALGEPLDLVPADAMLTWYGRPLPDSPAPEAEATPLEQIIGTLPQLAGGRLDRGQQMGLRVLQVFGQAIRFRHALTLIDASALLSGATSQARKADKLRLALIVECPGYAGRFRRITQMALNDQTSQEFATLEHKSAGGWSYDELRDRRLPDWAAVAWGELGPYFVLTLGDDVWPQIARVATGADPSLARDPWLVSVRGPRQKGALIEIHVSPELMRARLDPLLDNKVTEFFALWDTANVQQAHWALGLEGRALYCIVDCRVDGQPIHRVYADPDEEDPNVLALVPVGKGPHATRYAVYRLPAGEVIKHLVQSLYFWQTPAVRERATKLWARAQAEGGFDGQRDILDHLGDTLILHNEPPHPLHLPLFFTTLVEIKSDPQRVRDTLEKLCTLWQQGLEKDARARVLADPAHVMRESDGVWYVQVGMFQTLAWTVTDKYIVISWSPSALREYIAQVRGQLAMPAAAP